MGEDRMLLVRGAYFDALSAYRDELGKTLQLLTVTPDNTFDSQALTAQRKRETAAFEHLRDMRRLYAEELSYWEEETTSKAA